MMEQLCLDELKTDEQKAFELVYPELSDIVYNAPIESGILNFREISNCSSVYFLDSNSLLFQIRLRKKTRFLLIPEKYAYLLPADSVTSTTKSDEGMIRVSIQTHEDILKYVSVLRAILENVSRNYSVFGCCGRYEACSDAKQCIHPDVKFALGCKYRQNLLDGKIFYGKNKNIK